MKKLNLINNYETGEIMHINMHTWPNLGEKIDSVQTPWKSAFEENYRKFNSKPYHHLGQVPWLRRHLEKCGG